jgi:molybdenum cofactor cytidylyltransferase
MAPVFQVHFCARKVEGSFEVIAAVILAAGASRRMGSPKALLDYQGEPFLNRLIRVLGSVCHPVIAVLGSHADVIRANANGVVQFVVNPDPERGQLSSLQTGLAAVPRDVEGFAFTPVDSPAVCEGTLDQLVAKFHVRKPETQFVIPRYQGQRGHPVFAAAPLLAEFLALPLTAQAKDIVHAYVPRTEYLDVDDPGILADIDDRAAYQQLLKQQQLEQQQ